MAQQRQLFRIPLRRAGRLRSGSVEANCQIIDITEQGLHVESSLTVDPGATVGIDFQLTDARRIQCVLTVRHAEYPRFGGAITAIGERDQQDLSQFIEQILALTLTGF